jgi:hypothetical protein
MAGLVEKRERYLKDSIPIRLGGIAANLARVQSFSRNSANRDAVFGLFDESKFFIEWTAAETEIETAERLVDIQLQIAVWQRIWNTTWNDDASREQMARTSAGWSREILERSGLMDG